MEFNNVFEYFDYLKVFDSNFQLLLNRFKRFQSIDRDDTVAYFTYFDILIVQLRALCIENSSYQNNYTMQVLMRKIGKDDLANSLDALFENKVTEDYSIREAVKFIADKFVCHYDKTDIGDRTKEHICRAYLVNPYNEYNLKRILEEVINILGKGLGSIDFKSLLEKEE